jgi:hypothetical protein
MTTRTPHGDTNPEPREPSAFVRRVFQPLTRVLNPQVLKVAGGRRIGTIGQLYHCGRRSGRRYVTPVGVRLSGAGFLIPLTCGQGSDWCQNVLHSGGGAIRWKDVTYRVCDPEVMSSESVRSVFHPMERVFFRMVGIDQFLRLRTVEPGDGRA